MKSFSPVEQPLIGAEVLLLTSNVPADENVEKVIRQNSAIFGILPVA